MGHIPATISSVRRRRFKRGKGSKTREKGRESVWQEWMSVLNLFGEEGLGWGKSLLTLTSMDCSLGNMPAVCVFQAQTVVLSNHDLHIKVEGFDDGDKGSCQNKIITIPLLQYFHSLPHVLCSVFLFSYSFRHGELSYKDHRWSERDYVISL